MKIPKVIQFIHTGKEKKYSIKSPGFEIKKDGSIIRLENTDGNHVVSLQLNLHLLGGEEHHRGRK